MNDLNKVFRGAILLGAFCVAGIGCSSDVRLSVSDTEVVVAADAPKTVVFAADEMTNLLAQVFGRGVPVVTRPTDGKKHVYLGTNAWSASAGVGASGFAADAFAILAKGDSVYIAGKDDPEVDPVKRLAGNGYTAHGFDHGTLNGVYGFLERFADVRFYFLGEMGTCVPVRQTIVVPQGLVEDAPDMTVRTWSFYSDGKWPGGSGKKGEEWTLKARNCLRLRATVGGFACCHGLNGFRYKERFFKAHPEYFAVSEDGKRRGVNTSGQDGQLCFSSAITNEIFRDCLSYLKGEDASVRGIPGSYADKPWGKKFAWNSNVTPEYIDIMPQDGMMRCWCETCRKRFAGKPQPNYAAEQIWGFTEGLARRLKAAGYEPRLNQMAYTPYRRLPPFKLSPNISVMVAEGGPFSSSDPAKVERQRAEIASWREYTGAAVWIWTYPNKHPCGYTNIPDVPSWSPRAWGRYYKTVAPWIYGGFCESECDRAIYNLLGYYVFSKIAWDKSADPDAIVDEFYRRMFGAAAVEMRAFGDLLEKKWIHEVTGVQIETPLGPAASPPGDVELWTRVYGTETMDRLAAYLAAAKAKLGDGSLEARRVDFFRREMFDPLKKAGGAYRETVSVRRGLDWIAAHPDSNLVDFAKTGRGPGKFIDEKGPSGGKAYQVAYLKPGKDQTTHDIVPFTVSAPLKPKTKYRLSYFLKMMDVKPLQKSGGVGPILLCDRKDKKGKGVSWVFPSSYRFLSGTCDWIYQSFDFETDENWDPETKTTLYLRLRLASGTVCYDAVRVESL